MTKKTPITVAYGDGIGPEIMEAALNVLEEAGAALEYDTIVIGESIYEKGVQSGIDDKAWESLRRTKVFLKAPITTPQGKGVKSLNVTIRKTLGLYANVRPCKAYNPYIFAKHPDMDVVIIRENEEGLYGGIEHQQTPEVVQCLKLVSRPGCEKIIRYAFEYAKTYNRNKVTCFTKDNIMKLTDGMFHTVFKEVAREYPEIETQHLIVDIGAARLADTPDLFDVIVCPNLYGDIMSDIAAQIAGSVGLAGSANIGETCAMFEAIHGSAPDIAGKKIANPSGLIMAAVMMLVHIGQPKAASKIHNALLKTLEDGIFTADIFNPSHGKRKYETQEFAAELIDRLGERPQTLKAIDYPEDAAHSMKNFRYERKSAPAQKRELMGVDLFFYYPPEKFDRLVDQLKFLEFPSLKLKLITNRGTKVWPDRTPETFCTDHWRCRFLSDNGPIGYDTIISLLTRLNEKDLDAIKTENLYHFDQHPGYSKGQGE